MDKRKRRNDKFIFACHTVIVELGGSATAGEVAQRVNASIYDVRAVLDKLAAQGALVKRSDGERVRYAIE